MALGYTCKPKPSSEKIQPCAVNEDSQQAVATWTVFVLSFLIIGGFLHTRNQLTVGVAGLYWFPPIVLTLIGMIPPPWKPFVD